MNLLQDIRPFLRGETRLAKAFLVLTALSALLVPISWFRHGFYVYWVIYPMHLAGMVVGFILFGVLARRNFSFMFGTYSYVATGPLPAIYWPCLAVSLLYLLLVFFSYFAASPHGIEMQPSVDLRIAASFYLFMNLGGFGFAHWVGRRQRTDYAA